MRKPPFDKPLANYAIVLGIGIVFFAVALAMGSFLQGQVEVARGTKVADFVDSVSASSLVSVAVCLALSLIWLYATEHAFKIDWRGVHTQRSWWLIFLFFATLAVPGIGYALIWPSVLKGGPFAFGLLFACALVQFWSGTLLASPNPLSVVGGRVLRKTGLV